MVERVHALVASTDTPAAAAGGGTAALLRNTSLLTYAGFAMTAKPSVNLLILLQVTPSAATVACLPMLGMLPLQQFWNGFLSMHVISPP